MLTWTVLATPEDVAAMLREKILHAAQAAIRARDAFHVVLAGGRTPETAYRQLAEVPADWERWHVWFGDERCLPAGDPERNSTMARRTLLDRAAIPPAQVHVIDTELGAEQAAQRYAAEVADALPFDLVLLGIGEDGHTASLFPGHVHPPERVAVAVHDAPKPPPDRVSLNAGTLARTRQLVFAVTGAAKRDAVARWRAGEELPVASIRPECDIEVLIDRAAFERQGAA